MTFARAKRNINWGWIINSMIFFPCGRVSRFNLFFSFRSREDGFKYLLNSMH